MCLLNAGVCVRDRGSSTSLGSGQTGNEADNKGTDSIAEGDREDDEEEGKEEEEEAEWDATSIADFPALPCMGVGMREEVIGRSGFGEIDKGNSGSEDIAEQDEDDDNEDEEKEGGEAEDKGREEGATGSITRISDKEFAKRNSSGKE